MSTLVLSSPVEEPQRMTCRIDGMDCIECAKKIEKAVKDIEGVKQVRVSYTLGKMSLEVEKGKVSVDQLKRSVGILGYKLEREEGARYEEFFSWENHRLVATTVSGVLFFLGMVTEYILHVGPLFLWFYAGAIIVGGYCIARRGVAAVIERYLDINMLMVVAVAGSIAIGAYSEGSAIVFLFSLAVMLESFSIARTRRSISELMDFAPNQALVKAGEKEEYYDVNDVSIGDIVVVRPGERVPMDGVVEKGQSSVDESAVTGESKPAKKKVGDIVFAGTLNAEGYLEFKVTKKFQDTVISKIVKLVEEAETKKAPTERLVDRFARYYTPIVVLMAVMVMILPTLLFSQPFEAWFYRGLVLLVISCPCALVISTPVSVVSAITGATRKGILFKGGAYLERMGQISIVAFDKTGTITRGRPEVEEIVPLNGYSKEEVLKVAASAENRSEHHLARAVMAKAKELEVTALETESFEVVSGKGVSAVILGKRVYAGSLHFFRDRGIDVSKYEDFIGEKNKEGKTAIVVGTEKEIMGLLTVRDMPRPEAKETIAQLKALGIKKVVMLTGDDERVAARVAKELGIDEYKARLLPEEKVKAVEEYQVAYGPLIMIGDGVNDAPALATAEIGVAMGVAGTDIALEAADVALMGDDLRTVVYGVRLSRKAAAVIKQNVSVSLAVKMLFFVLVFPGLITLWLAILIGDLGTSFGVITNAMRLVRY
ncbi:MAG: cation-translocating P-type ATPase [Methanomassiliicoccales archaeon]|jgi:Cd2+/Zn2+-exporting ATPase